MTYAIKAVPPSHLGEGSLTQQGSRVKGANQPVSGRQDGTSQSEVGLVSCI